MLFLKSETTILIKLMTKLNYSVNEAEKDTKMSNDETPTCCSRKSNLDNGG